MVRRHRAATSKHAVRREVMSAGCTACSDGAQADAAAAMACMLAPSTAADGSARGGFCLERRCKLGAGASRKPATVSPTAASGRTRWVQLSWEQDPAVLARKRCRWHGPANPAATPHCVPMASPGVRRADAG
ncbi:hypothetical protein FA09DRAFT_244232 [Tilletiopsis washingtonensis]|uniref:Uncharacterized protein n=1 Tax=Tilletiopsis washingtonensis TaxID=58919 RepID=A0A316ZFQ0_9BASI|nr:hypothetical protein FA09DRAFT_244232 [Tilletiopsis washingtonensis]PWN99175.1 hypothetical protein FA09DRAFT_244232 [Tilletiopsis washingtonensis]